MNICIFGDSITWGSDDVEKGGWVERLKSYYMASSENIDVYNLGVCGSNTEDLLVRFENEARMREPDLIIFSIGINDSHYIKSFKKRRIGIKDFANNIKDLHEGAIKFTDKIVFIGLTRVDENITKPISWNLDKEYDNEAIGEYNRAIEDFCGTKNIRFISMDRVIEEGDLSDGLHPGSKGHEKMFLKIKSSLSDLV